jgi:hypothetical protein
VGTDVTGRTACGVEHDVNIKDTVKTPTAIRIFSAMPIVLIFSFKPTVLLTEPSQNYTNYSG